MLNCKNIGILTKIKKTRARTFHAHRKSACVRYAHAYERARNFLRPDSRGLLKMILLAINKYSNIQEKKFI